jgi:AcrR family transcriptional regulator
VPAPARRRLPAAERREHLLAAALEEFSARGYHATQMEHVATAAGVSKALLYQHFPSKEELFAAVVDETVGRFTGALPALVGTADDALGAWRAAVSLLVGLVEQMPSRWRLVARYLADPELGVGLRAMREALYEVLADVLVDFYAPTGDRLPEAELRTAAAQTMPLLVGGLTALLSWWLEHPGVPRAEVEQRAVETLWLGLDRLRTGERLTS